MTWKRVLRHGKGSYEEKMSGIMNRRFTETEGNFEQRLSCVKGNCGQDYFVTQECLLTNKCNTDALHLMIELHPDMSIINSKNK